MNFARNAILTAIIFQMTHATFPARSGQAFAADEKQAAPTTVPSTASFINATLEMRKDLERSGCIDKDGVAASRAILEQTEIQKEDGKGISCSQAITNYLPAEKQALEIMKEEESVKNENCADCGNSMDTILAKTGDLQSKIQKELGEGKTCSEKEKEAIQKENKSCSYSCGLKNAAVATVNTLNSINPVMIPVRMMFGDLKPSTAPNCPVAQGNAGDCIWQILKTLVLSTSDLLLGIWNGLAGWANGLFSGHKEAENVATKKLHAVTGMSDEEIKTAKKDGGKSFLQKMKNGLLSLVDFLTNYKELGSEFDCVHCKDKLKPVCKVLGLLGRDVVVMWVSGKILSKMGPLIKKLAGKNVVTRRLYRKGFVAVGRLSQKTAAKYAAFKASTIKFTKKSFRKTTELPGKIVLAANKGTTRLVENMSLNDKVIRRSMGEVEAKAALQPIDDVVKNVDDLLVGMETPGATEAAQVGKEAIVKLPNAKNKKWLKPETLEGMEGAEAADFVVKQNTTVVQPKVKITNAKGATRTQSLEKTSSSEAKFAEITDAEGNVRRFPIAAVDANKKLVSIETFKNPRGETNAIVKHSDGSYVIHTEQGATRAAGPKVTGAPEPIVYDSKGSVKVPTEKAALVDEATGKTIKGRPAEEVRMDAITENLDNNGIKYTKTPEGIKYEAPNGCGNGLIGKASFGR